MAATEDFVERRRFKRTHVIFSGLLRSGRQGIAGQILDISAAGVRMRLPEAPQTERNLDLRLARTVHLESDLAWRRGNEVGLRFRASPGYVAGIFAGIAAPDPQLA